MTVDENAAVDIDGQNLHARSKVFSYKVTSYHVTNQCFRIAVDAEISIKTCRRVKCKFDENLRRDGG